MHISVLKEEVIGLLEPKKNQNFIDCTVGIGGHAAAILEKTGPKGKLLAIDQDEKAIEEAKKVLSAFEERVVFYLANFAHLAQVVRNCNFGRADGILADLGLGSWQIEDEKYGLSFSKDMVLNKEIAEIVNSASEKELADILYQYGDVRRSWAMAKRLAVARRKERIETTFQLRDAINTTWPKILAPIFQALRIAAYHEFENLEALIEQATEILAKGGRLAIISFHSGEDRIVKNRFRELAASKKFKIITKKPVIASEEEIARNSRARSAKLRVIERSS